ncbi:phosphoribosylglycinamide formyltransferase [Schleiferilactobacillus shenzhenensis]|uniref:Phosphoribosylglycinamide formyltransferase n=1 Tax=Schleiferilactobacillus shenzhenensis LY-73 TaxID=1231336 RepID=U4TJ68_9LACO|nr:phosphoribosylglycinamide formyltransferase [Schleiferilactobacillus shenzhenensis]ERL64841.1 PurN [Schleiferilactobacillus shenzhenensis LY-73]
MKRLAVFASGNGTNFEALADYFQDPAKDVQISVVVCDHRRAPVIAKAAARDIPVQLVNYKQSGSKQAAEEAILAALPPVDLIVLAGFMRIIGPTLLAAFPRRIVNLHPALLPAFPGRTGIADAYAYGVKITGVTVHFVDAGIDTGEIIAQEPVRILPGMTEPELETAIHTVEHRLLPATIEQLMTEGVC